MTKRSEQIADFADHCAFGCIPIIFNGARLRKLGEMPAEQATSAQAVKPYVDNLLIQLGFSATSISIAEALGRKCVLAHS